MTTTFTTFTSNGGHSPKAPGASANGFKEHEQTRLCNEAFINAMKKRGFSVVDTTSDGKNKYAVLQEQVAKANHVNAGSKQLDVSFHLNASNGAGHGTEVYYYSDDAKAIAASASKALSKALGTTDRGAKQDKELYFLRTTKATAVLIEVCFIDNPADMQALQKYREVATEARGLACRLGEAAIHRTIQLVHRRSLQREFHRRLSEVARYRGVFLQPRAPSRLVRHRHPTDALPRDGRPDAQLLSAMRKAAGR